MRKTLIAIPARIKSSRLPNKVLADIGGKPMLVRVMEQCKKSFSSSKIVLCTDSKELSILAKNIGIESLITSPTCSSGSERISSVVNELIKKAWLGYQINLKNLKKFEELKKQTLIINVQGDQPFLDPSILKKINNYCLNSEIIPEIVTPIYKLSKNEIHNPAVVKTLLNNNKKAIYFSRTPLPFIRDHKREDWHFYCEYWGHVGIYGFRADILSRWNDLPHSELEKHEKLEQLRLIDSGIEVSTFEVNGNFLSVDTIEQLEEARSIAAKKAKIEKS